MMSFKEVIILDWYDNIINAFCIDESNVLFYCNLLAINNENDEKIYVGINLDYFEYSKEIRDIIKLKSFLKDEKKLNKFLNVINEKNESWLIRTSDLQSDQIEIIRYKDDFDWNIGLFYNDYSQLLGKAQNVDNWWAYY